MTVSGTDSTLTNTILVVGISGNGKLNITRGGKVRSEHSNIGASANSTGLAIVDGPDSIFSNSGNLIVGRDGTGKLVISNGGLVSVTGILTIDFHCEGNSFINMSTGGMLALHGNVDDSLTSFLELISGSDAIRFWDDSTEKWTDITCATYGEDYTLDYITEGDLAGYTVLTVTAIPEPATILVMSIGLAGLLRRGKRRFSRP